MHRLTETQDLKAVSQASASNWEKKDDVLIFHSRTNKGKWFLEATDEHRISVYRQYCSRNRVAEKCTSPKEKKSVNFKLLLLIKYETYYMERGKKLLSGTTCVLPLVIFYGVRALSQYQIKQISWFCLPIISYFSVVFAEMRLLKVSLTGKINCWVCALEILAIQALNVEKQTQIAARVLFR